VYYAIYWIFALMMLFLDKALGTLMTHICYSCSTLL